MKKHILFGAATAALLIVSGCSVEDTVKDLIDTNAIYVVNGTGGGITVSVTDKDDKYLESHNLQAASYYLVDQKNTTVSYDGTHSHTFSNGGPYLYAATSCNADGYVTDTTNGNRVHVVNLTAQTFTDDIQIIDADGASFTISDDASACAVTDSDQANAIKVGNGMQVKIGNGDWKTVTGIPSEVEAVANNVKIDVIVYTTTEGTVVPMAGYDVLN